MSFPLLEKPDIVQESNYQPDVKGPETAPYIQKKAAYFLVVSGSVGGGGSFFNCSTPSQVEKRRRQFSLHSLSFLPLG